MINLTKVRASDLWYVIGYIATDGSLSIDGRHIYITSKDRSQLYLIRKALRIHSKIGRKSRYREEKKKYSCLQFSDVRFYRYLISIGLTPKKSLTLAGVNIDVNFFEDFLRGVLDGDGNISRWVHRTNRGVQWCMRIYSASPIFIQWLKEQIDINFLVEAKLYVRKRRDRINPMYELKLGKIAASKVFAKIYYPNCLALQRKLLLAKHCLQNSIKNGKLHR